MRLDISNIEDLRKMGVYCLKNTVNKKVYIGSTTNKFRARLTSHMNNLRAGTHNNSYLQNSWNKYGEDSFEFSILEIITNISDIRIREAEYIAKYDSANEYFGYNLTSNTMCASKDIKVRDKISKTLKELYKNNVEYSDMMRRISLNRVGKPSWNKGIKCPSISKARRDMFDKILVLDLNKTPFKLFNSMIELIEYSNIENNDLPIIHSNGRKGARKINHRFLRKDKVYNSIRTSIPYKGLYFQRVQNKSDKLLENQEIDNQQPIINLND